MDVDSSVTIDSSAVVDDVVHIFRSKKIKSDEIAFATSTQDFKFNSKYNGRCRMLTYCRANQE